MSKIEFGHIKVMVDGFVGGPQKLVKVPETILFCRLPAVCCEGQGSF
jgi:hypothetical protein